MPDEFVRSGDVVLVDLGAEEIRRRIASDRVYSTDQVGGALAEYFRTSNIEALGELGRAWIAGKVEVVGTDLLVRRGLAGPARRQFVVAGASGSERCERVVRAAARLARDNDADLVVVHVNLDDAPPTRRSQELARYATLPWNWGGTFDEVQGTGAAPALADVVRPKGASRVVIAHQPVSLGNTGALVGRVTPSTLASRSDRRRGVRSRLNRRPGPVPGHSAR